MSYIPLPTGTSAVTAALIQPGKARASTAATLGLLGKTAQWTSTKEEKQETTVNRVGLLQVFLLLLRLLTWGCNKAGVKTQPS